MAHKYKHHLILSGSSIKEALALLNTLSQDAIIFVVNADEKLLGALTDGDIRRGFLKGFDTLSKIDSIIEKKPKYIYLNEINLTKIISFRENGYKIIPIVNEKLQILDLINFRKVRSYLPIDAVIMAGGEGKRLRPLTNKTPKPLLKIGEKTIIEHNLDRLSSFGIEDFWISINYLGEKIEKHLNYDSRIRFIKEDKPLGTIGAITKIKKFRSEYILLTNSDLLTNIDYEKFFKDFIDHDSDFAVLTIPYKINIPYAVLETLNGKVESFKEKPSYTYQSNGGVYLMKKKVLELIPNNTFFNATDLLEKLIDNNYKVISFPFTGYWLDIGMHDDFERAQKEINTINFK